MIKTEIVKLTPQRAASYLEGNDKNRPSSQRHMKNLSAEMRLGKWNGLNGETIKISKSGKLVDGQHRCLAVVDSGVTVDALVVMGVDDNVFCTIDEGVKRTGGHILAIKGVANYNLVSAIVTKVDKYSHWTTPGEDTRGYITPREVLEKYKSDPNRYDYTAHVIAGNIRDAQLLLEPSLIGACHYVFSQISAEESDEFILKLLKGFGLDSNSAILSLRNRLIQNSTSKLKLSQQERWALIIKSWNYERQGVVPKQLKWAPGAGEKFPIAI